jgi:hypothetical protein
MDDANSSLYLILSVHFTSVNFYSQTVIGLVSCYFAYYFTTIAIIRATYYKVPGLIIAERMLFMSTIR